MRNMTPITTQQTFRTLTIILITWGLLLKTSSGSFLTPPLEEIDPKPDGVTVLEKSIMILEEIPNNEDTDVFLEIARLRTDAFPLKTLLFNPSTLNFDVSATNGSIFLKRRIDFETTPVIRWVLQAVDSNDAQEFINFFVDDINDNECFIVGFDPPLLDKYTEEQEYPNAITKIIAEDKDKIDQDKLTYELQVLIDQDEGNFRLDNITGELFIVKPLNYQTRASHRLKLTVFDSGKLHNDSQTITIDVEDIPNLPPVWYDLPGIKLVNENTAIGELIHKVEARDGDLGLNWPIEYSMQEEHGEAPYFDIDKDQGTITVARNIDAEELFLRNPDLTILLRITAQEVAPPDGDSSKAESTVGEISITIRDLNDNPPLICDTSDPPPLNGCVPTANYNVEIDEGSRTFDLRVPFVARDLDSTLQFSKYIATFSDATPDIIKDLALEIQPNRESSGLTEYTIFVKDPTKLDYEDPSFLWHNEDGSPRPVDFQIIITESNITTNQATANINLVLTDINDNSPIFEVEGGESLYTFYACENLELGAPLREVIPNANPNAELCPEDQTTGKELEIIANDADISEDFRTVRYRWLENARQPPITLNPVTGKMTVNSASNFDYERFTEETFIVEAYDNPADPANQRIQSISVLFKILDRNDEPVDLRIPTGRVSVNESEAELGKVVRDGITARDCDLGADISITMSVISIFSKSRSNPDEFDPISPNVDINKWFNIRVNEQVSVDKCQQRTAEIYIFEEKPDREGGGEMEIDRVDLTITADDINGANQSMSQILTIYIDDANDEAPYWEDEITEVEVTVRENDDDDFIGGDNSTDAQREIYTFRARDPDLIPTEFSFDYKPLGCIEEFCEAMRDLVELVPVPNGIGKAILRRRRGSIIDREEGKFYGYATDQLKYEVIVSDGIFNSDPLIITINVEDINDNEPIWVVPEDNTAVYRVVDASTSVTDIETLKATDLDKPGEIFGIVKFLIVEGSNSNNGFDEFSLNLDSGLLQTKGKTPSFYNWSAVPSYQVNLEAVDYYRPGSLSGSNRIPTYVTILIEDVNDHRPEFLTNTQTELLEIKEGDVAANVPFVETVMIRDIDDPSILVGNGRFEVTIAEVFKEPDMDNPVTPVPFTINLLDGQTDNYKLVQIVPTKGFIGDWGVYHVKFEAKDMPVKGSALSASATYRIRIINQNFNDPEFEFPEKDNSSRVLIPLKSVPGERLLDSEEIPVKAIYADDKDDEDTGNGKVSYEIITNDELPNDGSSIFSLRQVRNEWVIYLDQSLEDDPNAKDYVLTIRAKDNPQEDEQRSATVLLTFIIVPDFNREPLFNDTTTVNVTIPENLEGFEVRITEAYDPDSDLIGVIPGYEEQIIYYHLVGGDILYFETEQDNPMIRTKETLDREEFDAHQVTIFVSNSPTPPESTTPPDQVDPSNPQYLVVTIFVEDAYDTAPEFNQTGIITAGIAPNSLQDDVLLEIVVFDRDLDDKITFTISSEIIASNPSLPGSNQFVLEAKPNADDTAVLKLGFSPQPTMTGFFTFDITSKDLGQLSTTAQCKIYIIKDSNVVEFRFLNRREFVEEKRTELAQILTDAFSCRCNIDRITEDINAVNATYATVVRAHFIDLATNEPVAAAYITEQQFDPVVNTKLIAALVDAGLTITAIGNSSTVSSDNRLIVYLLIAGIGIMAVVLLVLSATCYFNNRGLSRRVRALTATTFGSQQSGLNRTGAIVELPNTNEFAIEGSNPMWSTSPVDRKTPQFDEESVGSGGSVLIGVEDEDDFKNYKSSNNPLYNGNNNDSDEYTKDLYDTPSKNYKNAKGPTPFGDFGTKDKGLENYSFEDDQEPSNFSYRNNNDNDDIQLPPTSRRNPLLNMDFKDDDEGDD